MAENVVDIAGNAARPRGAYPVPDFWFAQVDLRLSRIEQMLTRLTTQVWLVVCGASGLLVVEIVQTLSAH